MASECWEELGGKCWEIHDGTSSEVEMGELLYGLVRMLKPELCCETGTYLGHSTLAIATALCKNGFGRLISIDTELNCIEPARKRCKHIHPDFIEIRHGNVAGGLPELEAADFVFSDSGFDMRVVEMDRIKPGCVMVTHDTRLSFDGSKPAGYLGEQIRHRGGQTFLAGRGFGILTR